MTGGDSSRQAGHPSLTVAFFLASPITIAILTYSARCPNFLLVTQDVRRALLVKTFFLALTVFASVALAPRSLAAQLYNPHYYDPYWDIQYQRYAEWQEYLRYLQQYDPYYELHLIHYQLYRQPYAPYPLYVPCCYSWQVTPQKSLKRPRAVVAPPARPSRRR